MCWVVQTTCLPSVQTTKKNKKTPLSFPSGVSPQTKRIKQATSNQQPTKIVGASLLLLSPNSQAFYAVFDNYFYDDSKSQAFHLAFYKLFSCGDTNTRDKERAPNAELDPVYFVNNPINLHRQQ